jgi:outer membrane protein assembly factor BamB
MRAAARALVVGALVFAAAGCWPVPGQNPDRTGYNDLETAITPATVGRLEQRWSVPTYGAASSPVVSTGGVHVVAGCALTTFDPATGSERWSAGLVQFDEAWGWPCDGDARRTGDPFVTGDDVYVGQAFRFYGRGSPGAMNPIYRSATGSWNVRTGEPTPGGLAIRGELQARRGDVVAGTSGVAGFGGTFPFFSPYIETYPTLGIVGQDPRRLPLSGDVPITVGTTAAYAANWTSLSAFAIRDPQRTCGDGGTSECPLWSTTLDAQIAGHAVLGQGGETVYVGTAAGTVYAVDAAMGTVLWTASVGSAVTDSPALAHGTLYVPTASGDLVAVPAGGCGESVCSPAWSAATGSRVRGQPAVAGSVLFTGSEDGALRAFDVGGCGAPTCPALWSAEAGSAVTGLAVTGGAVYASTATTGLTAYRLP